MPMTRHYATSTKHASLAKRRQDYVTFLMTRVLATSLRNAHIEANVNLIF